MNLLFQKTNKNGAARKNTTSTTIKVKPKTYGGVLLSELDQLAKEIYHGIGCKIDENGLLQFSYKSNRGRQTIRAQMVLDEKSKLISLGSHYPGQWWSMADEFAKKANERFSFHQD